MLYILKTKALYLIIVFEVTNNLIICVNKVHSGTKEIVGLSVGAANISDNYPGFTGDELLVISLDYGLDSNSARIYVHSSCIFSHKTTDIIFALSFDKYFNPNKANDFFVGFSCGLYDELYSLAGFQIGKSYKLEDVKKTKIEVGYRHYFLIDMEQGDTQRSLCEIYLSIFSY